MGSKKHLLLHMGEFRLDAGFDYDMPVAMLAGSCGMLSSVWVRCSSPCEGLYEVVHDGLLARVMPCHVSIGISGTAQLS